ncbi:RHS repeat protein [Chromobacterium violaceum]|uniref:RHS repeat protein n=1 Tax=Chromobacterium violaceum TaxID=536 RepID=UPI001B339D0C|nr:RHS repeat protein [Chromobacterium violaceum]MBP4044869.1 RHS repeat protein [Chromobacterium violaceum]
MATMPNLGMNTPDIEVLSPQGQPIRLLRYHRTEAGQTATERIERHTFHTLGHPLTSQDPRFFAEGTGVCNFRYHTSLSGKGLHTQSADAGESWLFCDIDGRPVWQRDARGTIQRYQYDVLGRPTMRRETMGAVEIVAERWVYGEAEANAAHRNLCGQWVRYYDTAGLLDNSQPGYALSGSLLGQQRRLLSLDTESDWRGVSESEWELALASERYATAWQHDLNGQMLTQTDAGGHRQRSAYDIAGRLKASWVRLNGGQEKVVLADIRYSAAGQKLREQAGNGVVTAYHYEAETQRLLSVDTTRPASVAGDRKTLLQRLRYDYDPVGNILAIHNDAEAARFFKNQRVTPDQVYRYDSLYQLIEACGREHAAATNPTDDPAFPLQDSANYVKYSRTYQYDAGGNLTTIAHRGAAAYIRQLTVSPSSNHAVPTHAGLLPAQVGGFFDAAGNQKQLNTGQVLQWNGLNQLHQVITSFRLIGHDRERYLYGGDGMRVRKTSHALVEGKVVRQQDVVYLPGLELRMTGGETLQVLTIGAAGRSQVRVLNWLSGKPEEIANQQLRYSMDDHLGSSQLELDSQGDVLTQEEYYPYGGTAISAGKSACEVKYKMVRYSGKERDASGLYYYGYRYYQPWLGRWLNPDPAEAVDGLNLFRMVRNNPVAFYDRLGNDSSRAYFDEKDIEGFSSVFSAMKAGLAAKNISPEETLFVMVGRSPQTLGSYIEHQGYKTALLQISGLSGKKEMKPSQDLSESEKESRLKFMNKSIGKELQGKKAAVLIDFATSGNSVNQVYKLTGQYLKDIESQVQLEMAVITRFLDEPDLNGREKEIYHSPANILFDQEKGRGRLNLDERGVGRYLMISQSEIDKPLSYTEKFSYEKIDSGESPPEVDANKKKALDDMVALAVKDYSSISPHKASKNMNERMLKFINKYGGSSEKYISSYNNRRSSMWQTVKKWIWS